MGCTSSLPPPTNPPDDDDDDPEVESVPQQPTTMRPSIKSSIQNQHHLLIQKNNALKLKAATKLTKHLPQLTPQVQQQFQERTGQTAAHSFLSIQYALHAKNSTAVADPENPNDPSNLTKAFDATSTLSAVDLSKALQLPHHHINPQTGVDSHRHTDDCFARQLHTCFTNTKGLIDYNQWVMMVGKMTSNKEQEFQDMMYTVFNVTNHPHGICYTDMLEMTMSIFQMACNDIDLQKEMETVGLDWISCSLTYEETLKTLVREWMEETFVDAAQGKQKQKQPGVGRQVVSKKQFNQWLVRVVDLSRVGMQTETTTTPTTKKREVQPKEDHQHGVGETDDHQQGPSKQPPSATTTNTPTIRASPIDTIDWSEESGSETEDEDADLAVLDNIHQSGGGTGYI